jgi:GLPGLI family protein
MLFSQNEVSLSVTYHYTEVRDAESGKLSAPEPQVLEVYSDSTQFLSLKSWNHRKLISTEEGRKRNAEARRIAWAKARQPGSTYDFASGFSNMGDYTVVLRSLADSGRLTVLDRVGGEYYSYPDTIEIDWTLSEETRTIIGYHCLKAVADFRGHQWIAWFSPEIPLPLAPWKLCGLPGLILEAYDSQSHYRYEAVGLAQGGSYHSPYLIYDKMVRETTLENYYRGRKRYDSVGGDLG